MIKKWKTIITCWCSYAIAVSPNQLVSSFYSHTATTDTATRRFVNACCNSYDSSSSLTLNTLSSFVSVLFYFSCESNGSSPLCFHCCANTSFTLRTNTPIVFNDFDVDVNVCFWFMNHNWTILILMLCGWILMIHLSLEW